MTATPPLAKRQEQLTTIHGRQLVDAYHWLRDYKWPEVSDAEVLAYIEAENAYTEAVLAPAKGLQDQLYKEMRARIQETDQSVSVLERGFYYYTRTEEGKEYFISCRRKGDMQAPEEVILDVNKLAEGKAYLQLGGFALSDDQKLLAYSIDDNGGERYLVQVKDLASAEIIDAAVSDSMGQLVWHKKLPGFYYTKLNAEWRPTKVLFHRLGTSQAEDQLIYEEQDPIFHMHISLSQSERYLEIATGSSTTSEVWLQDLHDPLTKLQLVAGRREGHEYSVYDHEREGFFILTNDRGRNFRLVRCRDINTGEASWQELIAHDPEVYLNYLCIYNEYWALAYRRAGLVHIRLYNWQNNSFYELPFAEPSYVAGISYSHKDEGELRYSYESLAQPTTQYALDFATHAVTTLKIDNIPSGYDHAAYKTERIFAPSGEVQVPISLVYRRDSFKSDGSNPLYLYGYGSYGYAMSANFRRNMISLLDRGYVFAIAHIRGGDEMGYGWYEQAKFANKHLTFDDFIACAEHLVACKYASAGRIAIHGGSAGGMLMGAVTNMRPDLWGAVVADVPFVDVLNTMLDETLPLTPPEFKEWGNPKDLPIFEAMLAYSPYDNVTAKAYPPILALAGLTDPRVSYWEPAKWVAKLRHLKTDSNMLLLKTHMGAGHGGPSGRFAYLEEVALIYSFILTAMDRQ